VSLKKNGGWLNDPSKWLTSAVKAAFRDLDWARFAQTTYATSAFNAPTKTWSAVKSPSAEHGKW
jgi:hypothetical protein